MSKSTKNPKEEQRVTASAYIANVLTLPIFNEADQNIILRHASIMLSETRKKKIKVLKEQIEALEATEANLRKINTGEDQPLKDPNNPDIPDPKEIMDELLNTPDEAN